MEQLKGFWYLAAPASDLGRGPARRPIRRLVEGEPLVLFRDTAGRPQALLDRCAHRGMALSAGKVVGDCIECPYHGWRYDGGGRLKAVPALCAGEPVLGIQKRLKTMTPFPAVESDDHIWVWLGEEGAPTEPDSEPFRFPFHGRPGWKTFFMQTRFEAEVEACLENFLDVPHTLFVHPGLFRNGETTETRVRVVRENDGAAAEFLDEPELQGWGPRLLFPKGTRMTHTDRFILPSITRVDYGFGERYRFVITSQCTRREERVVDVTTAITWRLPLPAWLIAPVIRRYCRHVIRQDVDMLAILGEQNRRFGPTALDTSADVLGRHISSLRRAAARGRRDDGPTFTKETVLRI